MKMQTYRFHCNRCDKEVMLQYAVWKDNQIVLVGMCDECQDAVFFSTDELISLILETNYTKGNGKVN